jgi:hypothetical protein
MLTTRPPKPPLEGGGGYERAVSAVWCNRNVIPAVGPTVRPIYGIGQTGFHSQAHATRLINIYKKSYCVYFT